MTGLDVVTILEVRSPRSLRGPWVIKASDGTKYATTDIWLASAADRFRIKALPVRLHGRTGWFYKELSGIVPVPTTDHIPLVQPEAS